MKISKHLNGIKTFLLTLVPALLIIFLLTSCESGDTENQTESEQSVVEVRAIHDAEENKHLFEMKRDTITSGWTTFEFSNASSYDHFFLIYKIPQQGIEAAGGASLLEFWHQNITVPFQEEYDLYVNGEVEFDQFTESLVGRISEAAPWFFDPGAQPMGGPGFTSAGLTSETTVYLESGEYIAECYVKNEDDVFHSAIGMLEHFTVKQEDSAKEQPEPTTQLRISSTEGIQFNQNVEAGNHTVEVVFEDQQTYGHLAGHNVQLVKLEDKNDQELLNELSNWFDWREPGNLVNRAPEGAQLMGGTMEMTEGSKAYYHVNLEPGDYAWIAEIPNPADHDMLKTFTISD